MEVLLQTGIDSVIAQARRLGITAELPPYPSLALGVADIPLKEMIRPFACFANGGKLVSQYYLNEIKDRQGNILYKAPEPEITKALSETEAGLMSNMLAAAINEGTGRRLRTNYGLKNEIAGKTGTTQNHVDGWFIGYNPRIVVGIRVGANNASIHFNDLRLGQGANMALPPFGEFMIRCLNSPTYSYWNTLAFPIVTTSLEKELEVPEFKDHLNLIDKITNKKTDSLKFPVNGEEKAKKEKKGFFKRLFGKKKDR